MINLFIILFLFTIPYGYSKSISDKFPNTLITPDYGILKEQDLDNSLYGRFPPHKYTDQLVSGSLYWQCFRVSEVKLKIRKWRDVDSMGLPNIIVTMCDFEIRVDKLKPPHIYGGRRALEEVVCNNLKKAWNRLIKNQKHICLNGESMGVDVEKLNGHEQQFKFWTWDKIKTKNGCYSYFGANDCSPNK